MNIEKHQLLTLGDNNEYIVVSTANYEGKNYIYLVDVNDNSNIRFYEVDNEENLTMIDKTNKELLDKIVPIFLNNCKDDIRVVEN